MELSAHLVVLLVDWIWQVLGYLYLDSAKHVLIFEACEQLGWLQKE